MLFFFKAEVIEIHRKLIEEFGGIHGLRDERALESALASAENRVYYEKADTATLKVRLFKIQFSKI
ncbi:hypothetical protein TI05_14335 [Achromatium sp. WMS3]|nr:hypothetical protein TI05_14335 [Achromatium sp. WMS3]